VAIVVLWRMLPQSDKAVFVVMKPPVVWRWTPEARAIGILERRNDQFPVNGPSFNNQQVMEE